MILKWQLFTIIIDAFSFYLSGHHLVSITAAMKGIDYVQTHLKEYKNIKENNL
jgi:hypothetical protein